MRRSPPRSRGSALGQEDRLRGLRVSPALAGIGPSSRGSPRSRRSLPRARGDRPLRVPFVSAEFESPPRSRGSAHDRARPGHSREVSPALAGIGPRPVRFATSCPRLPRARGDRPGEDCGDLHSCESPPRSRGSARWRPSSGRRAPVSPALAGIGPNPPAWPHLNGSLPRARGDRPRSGFPLRVLGRSPPRSRGSALHMELEFARPAVSPALAGIGPRARRLRSTVPSLPRARGDRPVHSLDLSRRRWSPPRSRGSAARDRSAGGARGVSPALAGIGPWTPASRPTGSRLPRARGDRPHIATVQGFGQLSPPRSRGSARGRQEAAGPEHVSPALAGIGPAPRTARASRPGLPRARGDRPAKATCGVPLNASPPRSRGSAGRLH